MELLEYLPLVLVAYLGYWSVRVYFCDDDN